MTFLAGSGGGIWRLLNGGADWDKEAGFLERGGGRGGTAREGFVSRTESIWTVGLPPVTSLSSSEAEGFPFFLTGSGGGGERLFPFQNCEPSVVSD